MTPRFTEEEQAALRECIARGVHRYRVAAAAELITQSHADALRRLGE